MEVEAWFIQEEAHFPKIDVRLTPAQVGSIFNHQTTLADTLNHPADTLDQIYQLAGKRYTKRGNRIQRTAVALDYANLYLEIPKKLPDLKIFVSHFDQFLV